MKKFVLIVSIFLLSLSSYGQGIPIAYGTESFTLASQSEGTCQSCEFDCHLQVSLIYQVIPNSGIPYWVSTNYVDVDYGQSKSIQYTYSAFSTIGEKKFRFRTFLGNAVAPISIVTDNLNGYSVGVCNVFSYIMCCDHGPTFFLRKTGSNSFVGSTGCEIIGGYPYDCDE